MDILERDRIAAACIALRPDWASNGMDRLKTMRNWLSEHVMDWSYRDALVGLVLVAADTSSNGPARLLTDGPWRTVLRHLTGGTATSQIPGYTPLDPECGYPGCGVRKGKHLAHVIPADIRPHEWEQPRPRVPASAAAMEAAHKSAFNRTEESNAS
jgi:hypothetical protein